jgi:competence protein ComEA
MFKKILAALLALIAAAAFAAVDVNKADQAALESVKGIGPAISSKILDERKKGSFKDWGDLIERVKGVGEGNAARFSADGLTVNGASFSGAPAATKKDAATSKAARKPRKEDKAAAKADDGAKPSASAASQPMAKKTAAERRAEKQAAAADKAAASASAAKK